MDNLYELEKEWFSDEELRDLEELRKVEEEEYNKWWMENCGIGYCEMLGM